jgi:cyclopropane-fatty-acyl-phospholipid synthase
MSAANQENRVADHKAQKQLDTARALIADLAEKLRLDAQVELWDGSRVPLGPAVSGPLTLKIAGPGVIGALLRKPTLDNLIRHYIDKRIDLTGGSIIDLGRQINRDGRRVSLRGINKGRILSRLAPFVFAKDVAAADAQGFGGDIIGRRETKRDNSAYISFHYDLSNEFYALFLDSEMVYSCAYFTDWSNDIARAQFDKLEMICRKLRLKPGESFLDIGCGWGGLVCHAAQHHGVKAHGISLSNEQLELARAKVKRRNLEDRVTLEYKDYSKLSGTYDKIASIGMYEHIGLKNIPLYMQTVRGLLSEDGLFLNHAISRRAKRRGFLPEHIRPEQRALAKYIFPGGALDDIGHTVAAMELAGFEVHDVEGWRMHYARTCQLWCERLMARKDEAIKLAGEEKYRIYVAYLAGCSLAFQRGTARLFQTLASKSAKRPSPLPPTRADLYR